MKSFAVRCFAAVLVSVNPSTALAQITTIYSPEPIPTTSASISVLLTAAVLLLGLRKIWQRRVKASAQLLAIGFGLFAINLWQSPELRAQLRLAFSNPYGETLQIPIDRIVNEQTLVGFQYADFINSSGRPLMIRTIAAPTFEHCFPGGLSAPFLPPALPPAAEQSPYPECEEELRLRPDKICRYSVERACDLAEQQHQALLELSPAEITLEAFGTVGELTLRNNPNAQASARNLSIAPPGALVVSDDCGAELRPGDSCTISLQANGAGGPDPLEIHSDNSYDVSSLVSANAWDPEVPVSQRQTLALQRLLDDQQSCNPFTALPFAPDILGLLDINTLTALPSTSASYAEKGFEVRRCGNFTLLVQQELGQPVRSLLLIEGDIQPSYDGLFAQFDQSTLTDTIIYQVAPGFDSNALSPAELPDVLAAAVTRSYGGSLGLKAGQHITGRVTLRGFAAQVLSAMNYPNDNVVLTTGRELPPLAWQSGASAGAGQDDENSFSDGLKPTLYIELAHDGSWANSAGIQGLNLIDTTVYYDEDNNFGFWGVGDFNSNPIAMFYNGPLKFSKDPSDYLEAQIGFGARDITLGQYLAFMAAYQARYPNLVGGAASSATDTIYDGILASLNFLPLDLVAIKNNKMASLNFKSGDPFPDLDYFNLVALGPLASAQDGSNGPLFKLKGDGELFNSQFGSVDFTASASGASGTASGDLGINLPQVAGVNLGSFGAASSLTINADASSRSMVLNGNLQAGPLGGQGLGLVFSNNQVTFSIAPSCVIPTRLMGNANLNGPLQDMTLGSLSFSPAASLPTADPSQLLGCASDIFVLLENGVVYVFQAGQQLMQYAGNLLPDNQVTQIGLEGMKFASGVIVNAPAEILNVAANIPGATQLAGAASAVQGEINRLAAEAAKAAVNAAINFVAGPVLSAAGAVFDGVGDLISDIGSSFSSFVGSSGSPDSFSFSGTNFIIYPPGGGTVKIQAKDISIGHRPAGATVIPNIWVLHKTSGRPYKYGNPGSFTFVLKDSGLPPGLKLVRIDADPHQGAAAVDENGGIWVADVNSYWRLANGYASDVAIGGGYIWVIGSEPGPGGYRIYRAPFAIGRSNFSWQSMNGHGMKIDAGGDGCAWTINDSYQVWEYAANSQGHIGWQDRNFHAIDVAVSQTNRAWFTGFDYAENVPFSSDGGRLWVYNIPDAITGGAAGKPIWEVLDGRGDTIGAGDGTGVWVVDANGDIRAGSGRIGQGNAGNGYFACR